MAQPSREDVSVTERISAAAALFDINVVDHIIITRNGDFSFRERGLLSSHL